MLFSGIAEGMQSITFFRELHCSMEVASPPHLKSHIGWRSELEAFVSILIPSPGMAPKGTGRGHLHTAVRLPTKHND